MKLRFLGSGTSQGVPVIGCNCSVCISSNPRNKRLRSSAWLHSDTHSILIDVTPDFRQQALIVGIDQLDALLITHTHHDHVSGLDDIRPLKKTSGKLDVFIKDTEAVKLKKSFNYIFEPIIQRGGGVPEINLHELSDDRAFYVKNLKIEPLLVNHGLLKIFGFKIGNVAYITDAKTIPQETLDKIQGVDCLVLNALRYRPHETHLNFDEALKIVDIVNPKQTYFIHTTHDVDYDEISSILPPNVYVAYDGLEIDLG